MQLWERFIKTKFEYSKCSSWELISVKLKLGEMSEYSTLWAVVHALQTTKVFAICFYVYHENASVYLDVPVDV